MARRWSLRSKALLALALAAGAGSFALVRTAVAEVDALRPVAGSPVSVVVAATSLPRGAVLSEDHLRVVRIPSSYVPPGAVRSVTAAVGRTLLAGLAEGEPLTRTRMGTVGGPVASLVPAGLRAFVVASGIPPEVVRAGDRVDVLATFGGQRPYTDTVGSDLEVLAVVERPAGVLDAGGVAGPSLVLLVSPETAERLAHAAAFGRLSVAIAPPLPG